MMTKSCARAACSTVVAVAPVSAASAARDAGPRELAIDTWCPSRLRCLARVLPTLPEPMIPMSIFTAFRRVDHDSVILKFVGLRSLTWRYDSDRLIGREGQKR
jgi:hypothetical protein